jgi:N-acetylmuramoyl-L-alanine amidase
MTTQTPTDAEYESVAADRARDVFAGLEPRIAPEPASVTSVRRPAPTTRAAGRALAYSTMPVMVTGALVLGLGLTGPVDAAQAQRKPLAPKPQQNPAAPSLRAALSQVGAAMTPGALGVRAMAAATAPATYVVVAGDTVSDIAARFGLSTPAVLAMNGLGWNSLIFPGQVLKLSDAPTKVSASPAPPTQDGYYEVVTGDTVSGIAARFGMTTQAVLDANGLGWRSIIYPGQQLRVPGAGPRVAEPTAEPAAGAEQHAEADAVLSMPVSERPTLPGGPVEEASPTPAPSAPPPAPPAPPPAAVAPAAPAPAPAPAAPIAPPTTPSPGTITALNADQRAHAQTIISVGRQLGVPDYGIVIALATAMQESSLRNLSWGHLDSVGLFQQRPSSGWGTSAQLQDPVHATRLFYGGPQNPNAGRTRGLLDIRGWQSMSLTVAAQAVQISAYPDAYAKWETSAWAWLAQLG